jgi:hypothetical protein
MPKVFLELDYIPTLTSSAYCSAKPGGPPCYGGPAGFPLVVNGVGIHVIRITYASPNYIPEAVGMRGTPRADTAIRNMWNLGSTQLKRPNARASLCNFPGSGEKTGNPDKQAII